eukprot:1626703-Rhodomonas_salina.3
MRGSEPWDGGGAGCGVVRLECGLWGKGSEGEGLDADEQEGAGEGAVLAVHRGGARAAQAARQQAPLLLQRVPPPFPPPSSDPGAGAGAGVGALEVQLRQRGRLPGTLLPRLPAQRAACGVLREGTGLQRIHELHERSWKLEMELAEIRSPPAPPPSSSARAAGADTERVGAGTWRRCSSAMSASSLPPWQAPSSPRPNHVSATVGVTDGEGCGEAGAVRDGAAVRQDGLGHELPRLQHLQRAPFPSPLPRMPFPARR